MTEDLKRHFSKDTQMTTRYGNRCSTSLIVRDMNLTPVRMAPVKRQGLTRMWREGNPYALLMEM